MDFYNRPPGKPSKLAIFPGAFNPPTRAHMAMAQEALKIADEVLFALPRVFPHKRYTAASFDDRLDLLRASISDYPQLSLAASDGGLFIDIAREARRDLGPDTELFLLCGRDAAERAVAWDYGANDSIAKQLELFQLLVASRDGAYTPPPEIAHRVRHIDLSLDDLSSSEVRRRIRAGEKWQALVPEQVIVLMEKRLQLWI